MCREIETFPFRETIVLPVQPAGLGAHASWVTAYGEEPQWLDQDPAADGLPSVGALRAYPAPKGRNATRRFRRLPNDRATDVAGKRLLPCY